MKIQKGNQGITLLALVITIIVLIILAGITINLVLGQNGILNKGKEAKETYAEQQAREKLELELANLYAEKELNTEYNENEYLTRKLEEKGFIVNEDIVLVDDYQFSIDRSIPQIGESLGKGNKNEEIKLTVSQVVSTDYVKSTIKAEIEYSKEIEYVQIAGEKKEGLAKGQDGKYSIEKDVTKNGTYSVYVKDTEGNYNIGNIKVEEVTEDMIINSLEDFIQFRNNVNNGRTYEGKTVTLNSDIDLSNVCGAEIGSWEPIGNYGTDTTHIFKGTFNGNYHKIDNLYIDTTNDYQGLFGYNAGTIENIIIRSGEIKNAGVNIGSIVGCNYGIINCCGNHINITSRAHVGGIAGNSLENIIECYNLGNITGSGIDDWGGTYSGGIVGYLSGGKISNCYNAGTIIVSNSGQGAGGILGIIENVSTIWKYIENCYNVGNVIALLYAGSITGNVTSYISIKNCYYTSNNNYYGYQYAVPTISNVYKVNESDLQGYATVLGNFYTNDIKNTDETWKYNDGYPILKWQLNVPISE